MLLGGVAWIGAHDLIRKAIGIGHAAARDPGRFAGLEVALYLSEPACGERESTCGTRRRPNSFLADFGERDECVLHPAARQHDLHNERHDDAVEPARRYARYIPRLVEPL